MVSPPIGGSRLGQLLLGHNPFLNDLNQLSPAFLKGLACSPNAHKAGNMSVIWIRVVNYLIFGFFKSCLDVFSEHADCI